MTEETTVTPELEEVVAVDTAEVTEEVEATEVEATEVEETKEEVAADEEEVAA